MWVGPFAAMQLTNRYHQKFSRSGTFYWLMLRHAEILRHRAFDPLFGEQHNNKLNTLMGLKKNVNCLLFVVAIIIEIGSYIKKNFICLFMKDQHPILLPSVA